MTNDKKEEIMLCNRCFDFVKNFIFAMSCILINGIEDKEKLVAALKYYVIWFERQGGD